MKRLSALLGCLAILFLCSCASQSDVPEGPQDVEQSSRYEDLERDIHDKLYYAATVDIDGDETLSVNIVPTAIGSISEYGEVIYRTKQICEETLAKDNYSLTITFRSKSRDQNQLIDFIYKTSFGSFGTLIDVRSGETKASILNDVSDLVEIFPALARYINLEQCPPEDIELYDDVMYEISSDMSRTEDEIISSYAEKIGKSSDELSWFIRYMQDISFSGTIPEAKNTLCAEYFSDMTIDYDD